jgi:hypothetical protein
MNWRNMKRRLRQNMKKHWDPYANTIRLTQRNPLNDPRDTRMRTAKLTMHAAVSFVN